MNLDFIAALVNLGSAGAVIIVVIYFLKYLSDQRVQDRSSLEKLASNIQTLTQELVNLRRDFDVAVAAMRERTKPRTRKKTNE